MTRIKSPDALQVISMENNSLTGEFPILDNLQSLVFFSIAANKFHSHLTFNATLPQNSLIFFSCANNQFQGEIPDFTIYHSLKYLFLHSNQFDSTLPNIINKHKNNNYYDYIAIAIHQNQINDNNLYQWMTDLCVYVCTCVWVYVCDVFFCNCDFAK